MTVKKEDLVNLTPEEEATVARLEKLIDDLLKETYIAGQRRRFHLAELMQGQRGATFAPVSTRIIQTLVNKYRASGWEAEQGVVYKTLEIW